MDTSGTTKINMSGKIDEIKLCMPETYRSIQTKAAEVGNLAYELVRRGLRGEVKCFYAFEAGRVVGTPFDVVDVNRDIAQLMVQFGAVHVCIWAEPKAVAHGAH